GGLRGHVATNRAGEGEGKTDPAHPRTPGSRGGFASAEESDGCAHLHFKAGGGRGSGRGRGGETVSGGILGDRGAPHFRSFTGRNDVCSHRTFPSGCDRGRLSFRRLDGWREYFVRGRLAKQPRQDSNPAG